MMIQALFRKAQEWRVAQLEVSLIPGLPALHVLGLSQRALAQWLPKFKSAFRARGLEWPKTKQIVVQIRGGEGDPVGLDLALVAAVMHATGQLEVNANSIYCGDVSLKGDVLVPPDLVALPDPAIAQNVVTGVGNIGFGIQFIDEIQAPARQHRDEQAPALERPALSSNLFSEEAAQLLKVVALGEHPTLIAGPHGSGKSTWVEALVPLLPLPNNWIEIWRFHKSMGEDLTWRPYLAPHHTSSALAILGGGIPPQPGEISRAHGGLLFLDEYLEFPRPVQDALREPLEKGSIRIARGPHAKVFESRFMLVAATNLCHCGKLVPDRDRSCQFSLTRCRSRVERLSGPMLDRFHILALSHKWRSGPRTVSHEEILAKIEGARGWRRDQGFLKSAASVDIAEVRARLSPAAKLSLPEDDSSERRRLATLRIASTLADLEKSASIEAHHILAATGFTVNPYLEIGQMFA